MSNNGVVMVDPGGMKFEGWRTPTPEIPIIGLTGFFPSSFTKSGNYAMEMLKDQMKDPSKAYLDAVSVLIANIVFGNIGVSSGIVSNFDQSIDGGDDEKFGTHLVWDRASSKGYDKKLSKEEADLWYLWGGGREIYVDNSLIDWSGLWIPKGKK